MVGCAVLLMRIRANLLNDGVGVILESISVCMHVRQDVVLLMRDKLLCEDINTINTNTKYLPGFTLPPNVKASTEAAEAIYGAQYAGTKHALGMQDVR